MKLTMRKQKKVDVSAEDIYWIGQRQLQKQDELIASQFLAPLLIQYPYLPQSRGSIDTHSLVILMNDLTIHQRKSILEFGSGISTILIGRLIQKNGLNARLISVEHNSAWAETLRKNLKDEGLDDIVRVIAAPLEPISFLPQHTLPWYSASILNKELGEKRFDMVIVDGPYAYYKEIELARLPAGYYVKNRLETDFSLFLHDVDRHGEQQALQQWNELLGIKNNRFTPKLAGYLSGKQFELSI